MGHGRRLQALHPTSVRVTSGAIRVGQAEHDLTPYLDHWLNASLVNAQRNLALMITHEGLPNAKSPSGGYWAGHRQQWQELNNWLRLPEVRQKLASAVERWNDSPVLLP